MPYVRSVLDRMQRVDYEAAAVLLDPDAPTPTLDEEMSAERCWGLYSHAVAALLSVPHDAVLLVAARLTREGRLTLTGTGRKGAYLLCRPE